MRLAPWARRGLHRFFVGCARSSRAAISMLAIAGAAIWASPAVAQHDLAAPPPGPGAVGLTTLTFLMSHPAWNFFPLIEPESTAGKAKKK